MAIKQTRKSVSVSRQSYAALQQLATARGQSMAAIVEALISNAVAGKPEAVAKAPVVAAGGGPVDAFAAALRDAVDHRQGVMTWGEFSFVLRTVTSWR